LERQKLETRYSSTLRAEIAMYACQHGAAAAARHYLILYSFNYLISSVCSSDGIKHITITQCS